MPERRLVFGAELDNMGVVNISSRPAVPSPVRAEASADSSTRQRILDLLLANGSMTAAELAAALDLTATGIRRHLAVLTDAGEIEAKDQPGPRGRGRPAKAYRLTASGREGFGQAYDDLALRALAELVAAVGPHAVDRLAEGRLVEVEADYLTRRAANPDADPMQILAESLSAAGYFASAPDDGQLCQHHCPVAHVAAHFPQLCEAEASVFARLLGTDVSRSSTIALGDEICRTHLGAGPHPGRTMLPDPIPASSDRKVSA